MFLPRQARDKHKETLKHEAISAGWYTSDAAEVSREFGSDVRWLTADMRAGDVVILPLETLHCTAANMEARRHRISCDVRWVPMRAVAAGDDDDDDDDEDEDEDDEEEEQEEEEQDGKEDSDGGAQIHARKKRRLAPHRGARGAS